MTSTRPLAIHCATAGLTTSLTRVSKSLPSVGWSAPDREKARACKPAAICAASGLGEMADVFKGDAETLGAFYAKYPSFICTTRHAWIEPLDRTGPLSLALRRARFFRGCWI